MTTTRFPSLQPPRWPGRVTLTGLWVIAAGVLLVLVSGQRQPFFLGAGAARMTLVAGLAVTMIGTAVAIVGVLAAAAKRARLPATATVVGIIVGLGVSAYALSRLERTRCAGPTVLSMPLNMHGGCASPEVRSGPYRR